MKKSCKYGEYGSFEHLHFLFLWLQLTLTVTRRMHSICVIASIINEQKKQTNNLSGALADLPVHTHKTEL